MGFILLTIISVVSRMVGDINKQRFHIRTRHRDGLMEVKGCDFMCKRCGIFSCILGWLKEKWYLKVPIEEEEFGGIFGLCILCII